MSQNAVSVVNLVYHECAEFDAKVRVDRIEKSCLVRFTTCWNGRANPSYSLEVVPAVTGGLPAPKYQASLENLAGWPCRERSALAGLNDGLRTARLRVSSVLLVTEASVEVELTWEARSHGAYTQKSRIAILLHSETD